MSESLKSLKNYKKQLILGPIFKLTEAVFELIVPLLMAYIIDYGISLDSNNNVIGGDMGVILKTGSLIVALGILGLLCSIICQYFASRAGQGFGTELRNKMLKHIFKLPMSEQDKLGSAKLENIMINDINQLQTAVNMFIRLVVRAPFLVVGGIVCAFLINVKVALIFVASLPFFILVLVFVLKASSKRHVKIQASLDVINKSVNEGVTGQRVVRVFNAQDMMINDYKKTNDQLYKDNNNVSKITSLLSPLTFIIVNVATVFIVYFAAKFVDFGELTQGDVFTLVNYMNQILLALIVVSNLVVIFTKAFASLKRTDSLFALKEEESKDYVELDFDKTKPLLSLNKVSFKFDNSLNYILQNITFELNKGESLGIIGGTGSGKSTLVEHLNALLVPSSGSLEIEDTERATYDLSDAEQVLLSTTQRLDTIYEARKKEKAQETVQLEQEEKEEIKEQEPLFQFQEEKLPLAIQALYNAKVNGIELSESQERTLQIYEKLNSEKFREFKAQAQERARKQEERRKAVQEENARKEEWLNSADNPINMRLAELKKTRNQVTALEGIKDAGLIVPDQEQKLDNLSEFLEMFEKTSQEQHEVDTGMSDESRAWYQEHYRAK